MNFQDIEKYLKKSGDDEISTSNLVENQHGFMSWRTHKDTFVGINVYGDGHYWDAFANELAKKLGLKKIMFATKRSPKVFEKKYGYKITGYILEREVS